jgi:hypothetical protein
MAALWHQINIKVGKPCKHWGSLAPKVGLEPMPGVSRFGLFTDIPTKSHILVVAIVP